jgi:hypothetical protein
LRSGKSRPKAGCERKGVIYGQALNRPAIKFPLLADFFHCALREAFVLAISDYY